MPPREARVPEGVDPTLPSVARIYDYLIGGKDNYAADRTAARQFVELVPEVPKIARANRDFLVRCVRFLAQAGVRQFIDLGAGIPTSPNVHEVARRAQPGAHVVYVDHDPVVVSHAAALMATNDATSAVTGDLRAVDDVLGKARKMLDFTKPVGLLFVGCLHHILDSEDPAGIVAKYLAALAPGSYLVISHSTNEFSAEKMSANAEMADQSGTVLVPRSKEAILAMFNGHELVDPGLVLVSYWRPEGGDPGPDADKAWVYGGVSLL